MQTQLVTRPARTGVVIPFPRPAHAESLIKHTATLFWVDREGRGQRTRYAAWTAVEATRQAWVRARSMMLSGDARAFRIAHHQQAYDQ
jgi:hypothetical protein